MTKINLNEIETTELLNIAKIIEEFLEMLEKEEEEIRKEDNGKSKKDTAKN